MPIDNENFKRIVIISVAVIVVVVIVVIVRRKPQETQLSTYEVTSEKEDQTTELPQGSVETPSYYEVSEALDFLTEYPWYRDLPVETDMYIISWNLDRKEFRLRLKIPESSPQETIIIYTQSAIAGLKELTGELFDKYTYYIMYQN